MSKKNIKFSFLAFIITFFVNAQIFPVQITSNVNPPYLPSVASYATSVNTKYLVNIFTADVNVVNRPAYLKLYIEGNGILAQSKPVVNGAIPINLNGGESISLTNLDLSAYFELENLQNITPQQYANNLPEGIYNYCIEVYDVFTNQKISQKSCTFYYFLYNDPPFLTAPNNHDVIIAQGQQQNLNFTWLPRHINATNIEYEFTIVELLDQTAPSNYAFSVGAPFYQTTTNFTNVLISPTDRQFVEGKKYAWRVKAITAATGFGEEAVFRNNGYSEIFDFVYAGSCIAPTNVEDTSTTATEALISWDSNPDHLDYKVEYRKINTTNWFTAAHYNNQAKLLDLEPGATYEYKVSAICIGNQTTASAIATFTQPLKTTVALNCGLMPNVDLTNQILYNQTMPDDQVFMAGDFPIHVTEVTGAGSYTGKGWTNLPYFSTVHIEVEFADIKINTGMQLVNGTISATYDPTWGNIVDLNSIYDQAEDQLDNLSPDTDEHSYQVNFEIPNASSITVTSGSITVSGVNGETQTFDRDNGEAVIIRDANGTVYGVGPSADSATFLDSGVGYVTSANTNGLNAAGAVTSFNTSKAKVVFSRATDTKYADDQKPAGANDKINAKYKTVGDYDYYYKGIENEGKATRSTDFVKAEITITDPSINLSKIKFNLKGIEPKTISTTTSGTTTTVILEVPVYETVGTLELIALIQADSGTGLNTAIGAAMVVPTKIIPAVNITVVPVNGAVIPDDINAQLTSIYKGTGITFNTNIAANYTTAITTMACGNSLALEVYTLEQLAFIKTYQTANPADKNQYYVFVMNNITPSRNISGFMPLHSQVGFVFPVAAPTNASTPAETKAGPIANVIAHEIGHGVFELEHPWDDYKYTKGDNPTNWVMDYAVGTHLPYMHWQKMSHPKFGIYVFQSSEEGEISNKIFKTEAKVSQAVVLIAKESLYCSNVIIDNYIKNIPATIMNRISSFGIDNKGNLSYVLADGGKKYSVSRSAKTNKQETKIISISAGNQLICFDCIDSDKPKDIEISKVEGRNVYDKVTDSIYILYTFDNSIECKAGEQVLASYTSTNGVSLKSLICYSLTENDCINLNKPKVDKPSEDEYSNVIYLKDCIETRAFDKLHFSIQTETYRQRLIISLNENLIENAKNVKFESPLTALKTDVYKYLDGGRNYRNESIFKEQSYKELNNKLAYLEASTGIQLYTKFVETSCSFKNEEGTEFVNDIFASSNISKSKGIYVLIIRNTKSIGTEYDWKTYFAFGTGISQEIKDSANSLLTIGLTQTFNNYAKSIVSFYQSVPKKQIQQVYIIEKVSQLDYNNALNSLNPVYENIYFKQNITENAKGNAIQPYYIIKNLQTGSLEYIVLDNENELKEEYVINYGLDVAKKIAVQKANWLLGQKSYSEGIPYFSPDINFVFKCRFTFSQNCTDFYIDTFFLVAGIATIPWGNAAIIIDAAAVIYYASTGQSDEAMMYIAGYGLGPIIGATIKGIAQVTQKVIRIIPGKNFYIASQFSSLVNNTTLADNLMSTYINKSASATNKEYIILTRWVQLF